ncbi:hypothetical protein [Granulicella sp. S156]|uniref:hypothetical protein n=1 Tax=Granulicella sp. S156 TaxID=1747224 RepID=UPI00131C89B5|nr:hypothetical protein [Granulicella sp. S156]
MQAKQNVRDYSEMVYAARAVLLSMMLLFAVPFAQAQSAESSSNEVVVHNFMPDFWSFWSAASNKSPEEQRKSWQTLYIEPHAAVFADLAKPCAKHLNDVALQKEYFPTLAEFIPAIHALDAAIPGTIADARRSFLKVFPDMRWAGDIYIMASGGCFNGRSQRIQGREALLLGLDDIVELHETNLPPLLHHELFHRYHHAFFAYEPERDEPLWTRLWAEGMATYVSRRLNPTAPNMDALWIEDPQVKVLDDREQVIAADFLSHFDSTSQRDASLYFLDDQSKDTKIPARAGYYLGLRVAEQLGRHYSLQEMAHWNRAQAEPRILAVLRELEKKGSRGK